MNNRKRIIMGLLSVVLLCCILFFIHKYSVSSRNKICIQEIINLRNQNVVCDITVVNIGSSGVLKKELFTLKYEEKHSFLNSLLDVISSDVKKITKNVVVNTINQYEIHFVKDNSSVNLSVSIGPDGDAIISYHFSRLDYGVINISAEGRKKLVNTINEIMNRENQRGSGTDIEKPMD